MATIITAIATGIITIDGTMVMICTPETRPQTQSLLRLLAWMSPAFPLGGFAWSGGLERAVFDSLVVDARSLGEWLRLSISNGSLHNDGVLLAAAWSAHADPRLLGEVAALAAALSPSAERHAETVSLGQAFVTAASAWPDAVPAGLPAAPAFPVAVGAVAAAHGIDVQQTLAAWLHASVSQSVSAAIRLGVAGQHEGVRLLAALEDAITDAALHMSTSTTDDLGSAAIVADTASMRHEVQRVRLFRS